MCADDSCADGGCVPCDRAWRFLNRAVEKANVVSGDERALRRLVGRNVGEDSVLAEINFCFDSGITNGIPPKSLLRPLVSYPCD